MESEKLSRTLEHWKKGELPEEKDIMPKKRYDKICFVRFVERLIYLIGISAFSAVFIGPITILRSIF